MFTNKFLFSIYIIVLTTIILLCVPWKVANAQGIQRIGVFDSRAVAVAYYNSKFSNAQEIFQALNKKMLEAKLKNDTVEIARIELEANLRQAMLHEQGFGTGSISGITESIKDKMVQLAEEENLSAIVSKWEVVFSNKNIELIDVTEKVAGFFEPDEKIKAMVKDIIQTEPVKDAYLISD